MSIKKTVLAATASLLMASALPTFAEGAYIGAQFAQTEYEQKNTTGANGEGEPSAFVIIGGYKFTKNIAIEGRFGFNSGDDNYSNAAIQSIEVDRIAGVYGKFSLGETFAPYLLIGISDVEYDASNGSTAEGDGVSFGAGIDINVSESASIGIEYVQYIDEDVAGGGNIEVSAIAIGANYNF